MTTSELLGEAPAKDGGPDPAKKLYKTAGLGGLLAFVAWLGQPIQIFLGSSSETEDDPGLFYKTAEQIADERWAGAAGLAVFGGIGLGLLMLVTALGHAAALRGQQGVFSTIGHRLGLLAATGYLFAGTTAVGFHAFGDGVGDVTDDQGQQRILHVAVEAAQTGFLTAGAVGLAGWLLWLGTTGRKARLVGLPALVFAILFALAVVVPIALMSMPMGGTMLQPFYCLGLGIAFLVKSRK